MTEKTSKTRQGRANREQIEALVSHLEQHPYMATGKFNSMNANENVQEKWNQLSEYLNSLATDGKKKDVKSWKTTWRDYKSKVSEKIQKLRQKRSRTGNNPIDITLNELDERILGIIGHDYVQGLANVPDSFPEENYNAVEELASGSTDILNIPPAPIVIPELNNIDIDNTHIDNEDERLISFEEDRILCNKNYENESVAMENGVGSSILQIDTTQNMQNKTSRMKANSSKRLAVQFSEAREVFQEIANKADAMHILAEATLKMSEAIDKIAKNEERQTHLLQVILKKLDKQKEH